MNKFNLQLITREVYLKDFNIKIQVLEEMLMCIFFCIFSFVCIQCLYMCLQVYTCVHMYVVARPPSLSFSLSNTHTHKHPTRCLCKSEKRHLTKNLLIAKYTMYWFQWCRPAIPAFETLSQDFMRLRIAWGSQQNHLKGWKQLKKNKRHVPFLKEIQKINQHMGKQVQHHKINRKVIHYLLTLR